MDNSMKQDEVPGQNVVLVMLNIKTWRAHSQDVKVSTEVSEQKEVKVTGMARVWKTLLPKTCEEVKQMEAAQRAARTFHYENTLTYRFDGPRMLPVANYEHYTARMRQYKQTFEEAVKKLMDSYPALKEAAKQALGSMYDDGDYPSTEELRARYSFDIKFDVLPDANSFLNLGGLSTEDAERMRDAAMADQRKTYESATRRLWEDLYERLERFHLKLQEPDAYVKDDTINGVRDLAEMLPRLNIQNDPKLNALADRLIKATVSVTAAGIKANPDTRHRIAEQAAAVFNVMGQVMKPMKAAVKAQAVAPKRLSRGDSKPVMKRAA